MYKYSYINNPYIFVRTSKLLGTQIMNSYQYDLFSVTSTICFLSHVFAVAAAVARARAGTVPALGSTLDIIRGRGRCNLAQPHEQSGTAAEQQRHTAVFHSIRHTW